MTQRLDARAKRLLPRVRDRTYVRARAHIRRVHGRVSGVHVCVRVLPQMRLVVRAVVVVAVDSRVQHRDGRRRQKVRGCR